MSKISFIKTTNFMKIFGSYKQAGPGSPKYFDGVIILPLIFFKCFENSSTTIGDGVFVDKSSGSSGIFKIIPSVIIQNFWLCGSHFRILFKHFNNRIEPTGSDLNITV